MVFIRAHPRHPWLDFRARRHRRPSLRGRSFWSEQIRDDENHAAEDATANRRQPWSWVPWSLWHSPLGPRRSLSFALSASATNRRFQKWKTREHTGEVWCSSL